MLRRSSAASTRRFSMALDTCPLDISGIDIIERHLAAPPRRRVPHRMVSRSRPARSHQGIARVRCAATHFVSPCALSDDGAAPSWARHFPSYTPTLLSTPIPSYAYWSTLIVCPRVERVPRNAARVRSCGVRCSRVVLCSRRVLWAVCPCSASRHRSKC